MYIVSKIFFFIIIHLLYGVACVAVSNLLEFLLKWKGYNNFGIRPRRGIMIALFCSVLLTVRDT